MKIYKYMVENELCRLKEIDKSYFADYINKLSGKMLLLERKKREIIGTTAHIAKSGIRMINSMSKHIRNVLIAGTNIKLSQKEI